MATPAEIQAAYKAIYRADLNVTVATAIANTGITVAAYTAQELPKVASTTQAAVAITSFVTGVTPTSAQLDALKVEADKQVASYTALGVGNPALGAFEAFGRGLATDSTTTATFSSKYGALSNADFITTVYAQVYGTTPSVAAAANLTAQINYFTTLYTQNNVPNAALAAKGAVLGQIVGYAFVSDASANSTLDNQVQSFLTAAANGSTTGYAAALPTVAGSGTAGAILTLTAPVNGAGGNDVVDPASTVLSLKSTDGDDTIRALTAASLSSGDVINGGGGFDTLNAGFEAQAAAAVIAPVLNSVERVYIAGQTSNAPATTTFSGAASTGLAQVWNDGSQVDSTLKITNVAQSVIAGARGATNTSATATEVVFLNTNGTNDTAKIALDTITKANTFSVAGIENLQVAVGGSSSAAGVTTITDTSLKTLSFSQLTGATGSANVALATGDTVANLTTIDASAMTGGVTLGSIATNLNNITVTGGAGNDSFTFTGTKVITISTGAGNDTIVTGGGNDVIDGGAGNDIITAGVGADTITLGDGNDVVRYTALNESTSASTNLDTIADFKTSGSDKISITIQNQAPNNANPPVVGDAGSFTFFNQEQAIATQNAVTGLAAGSTLAQAVAAAEAAGIGNGQVGSFVFGGNTYVVANDTTATAANDLVIKLTGVVALSATDFIFA